MLLKWGQEYITFFTGSCFPALDPTIQFSSSYNVPSHHNCNPPFFSFLFFSFQLPVVFFKATYISLLSSSVLFQSLSWAQLFHCVRFLVCAWLWRRPWVTDRHSPPHWIPLNPDSSALFLFLWWMLVCFSFAWRIVALWEQGKCCSPATGVLGWGDYICSCLNNMRGEFV